MDWYIGHYLWLPRWCCHHDSNNILSALSVIDSSILLLNTSTLISFLSFYLDNLNHWVLQLTFYFLIWDFSHVFFLHDYFMLSWVIRKAYKLTLHTFGRWANSEHCMLRYVIFLCDLKTYQTQNPRKLVCCDQNSLHFSSLSSLVMP